SPCKGLTVVSTQRLRVLIVRNDSSEIKPLGLENSTFGTGWTYPPARDRGVSRVEPPRLRSAPRLDSRIRGNDVVPRLDSRLRGNDVAPRLDSRLRGNDVAPRLDSRNRGNGGLLHRGELVRVPAAAERL